MNALPSNSQICCTKFEVENIPMAQEGRITKVDHSLPTAVPLSESTEGGNDQRDDVEIISNGTAGPLQALASQKLVTFTNSHNNAPENESVLRVEQLLLQTNRKLDLLLKKTNRLQRRVTEIEKNMNFLEKHKKDRKENPIQLPGNSKNTLGIQDSLELPFSPVSCLFEMEKLEELAKDMHFVNYVKMQINRIVGLNVQEGEGISYCWRIIDYFFTRFFMTQCTWSGRAGRIKEPSKSVEKKIRFKDFNYVINMFYVTANYADPLFSKEKSEGVLKRAIKNAIVRLKVRPQQTTSTIPDGAIVIPTEELLPNMNTIDCVESPETMEFDPLEIKSEPES
ncbi:uncharacterized protein LOC126570101 [Anopheles aquasalis]|uniref:uncharacterized protein LOC126570101 n=1 Tax=Anopheles aquasalis TaxID=42839 RepID=UPI00215B2B7C|nr:uncharacterized protein LOC126570101 [Anopheles aquasalis]